MRLELAVLLNKEGRSPETRIYKTGYYEKVRGSPKGEMLHLTSDEDP